MPEKKPTRSAVAQQRSTVAKAKRKAGAAAPGTRTTASRPATMGQPMGNMHAHIQRRAYEIWESEGRPAGRECAHWLQAEREIMKTRAQSLALSR